MKLLMTSAKTAASIRDTESLGCVVRARPRELAARERERRRLHRGERRREQFVIEARAWLDPDERGQLLDQRGEELLSAHR
jgi:hypothetical protein